LKERSASKEHVIDLSHLLGEPTPADADPAGEWYCFEHGAQRPDCYNRRTRNGAE
jgi:hypothetical protein